MSISNEERLIRALVDEIYKIEEKINSLNESINKDKSHNIIFKRIKYLKSLKDSLLQQRISLNDSFLQTQNLNSKIIQEKLNKIKIIENNLESKRNELIEYNMLSFQCLPLKKCILSNKFGEFLTEEQINDIIFEGNFPSLNTEIKKLKREIEISNASECVIINNVNEISAKILQAEENIKMLKEEKIIIKNELINLISCKETLEQVIKLNINSLNIHYKINNKRNNDSNNENEANNKWTNDIKLYIYELNIIDTEKASNNICNELFDLFNLNSYDNNNNDINGLKNYFKINSNLSSGKNKRKSLNIYSYFDQNYNFISNQNEYLNNNNTEKSNHFPLYIQNKNKENIYNIRINNKRNNYSNLFFNSYRLNKNELIILIKDEIEKFISGKIYSYKTISEFLENLSLLITTKFQYINIIISSDILIIYLSYILKALYYEAIINYNLKFINKDYKSKKKEYKKIIPYLHNELYKLQTKYNEYKSKTAIIEKQIDLIKKENYNKKKNKSINLSLEEQNYIQICSKANILIKQKKNLEDEIKEYEIKNNLLKNENEEKTKEINIEINQIDKQIIKINEEIKNKKNKTNENIDYYQKIIQEKYNVIKKQLQIYKDKYGSNLDIYNRLINSINETIKKTYSKPPLIIINNNNNINNSHIFKNDIGKLMYNINNSKSKNKNIKNLLFDLNNNKNIVNFHSSNNSKEKKFLNNPRMNKSSYNINNNINKLNNILLNSKSTINHQIENIQEKKIKKINGRRKLNKALSHLNNLNLNDLSYLFSSNNKILSINNSENKNLRLRTKNNSLNYNITKNKDNSNPKKRKNDLIRINFIHDKRILSKNNSNVKNIMKIIKVNKNDKYNKSFSKFDNIIESNTINNEPYILNNTSIKNNKLKSFSFVKSKQFNFKIKVWNNIKNINNSRILYNSTNKKNDNILKVNTNNKYYNITKYSKEKEKIRNYKNIINNKFNKSDFIKEKESDLFKLSHITLNLKDKINKDEIMQNKFIEKINPLTKATYCYYREFNNTNLKYNNFLDPSHEILCGKKYNFKYGSIFLTKNYDILRIFPFDNNNKIDLNILDIENTMINSKIKKIIDIYRNYRRYNINCKSVENFFEEQIKIYPQFTREEIEKCIKNKKFNFSLIINGGKIFELIICSYLEFKTWINGLAFLIKNKKDILRIIKENENKNTLI